MPDSPQVGAPLSTPLKPSKMEGLFNYSVTWDPTMLQAVATTDTQQQVSNKKVHLLFFQRVDTVVNAMRFGLRWGGGRLLGSFGKSPAVRDGTALMRVTSNIFQMQAYHRWLTHSPKKGKAKGADLNKIFFFLDFWSLKIPLKKYICSALNPESQLRLLMFAYNLVQACEFSDVVA